MKFPENERVYVYRVDENNRIEWVNSDWIQFARENGANALSAKAVIGQPLFRYVEGHETQHLYQLIMERVRQTQRSTVVPFRCDGPAVRRFMELEIAPSRGGSLQFSGRVVREEKRLEAPLIDVTVARSDEHLVICSWCKQVDVSGVWMEVEQAVERMGLFNLNSLPQITHGLCPECAQQLRHSLKYRDC